MAVDDTGAASHVACGYSHTLGLCFTAPIYEELDSADGACVRVSIADVQTGERWSSCSPRFIVVEEA